MGKEVEAWNYDILCEARRKNSWMSRLPQVIISLILEYVWFNSRIIVPTTTKLFAEQMLYFNFSQSAQIMNVMKELNNLHPLSLLSGESWTAYTTCHHWYRRAIYIKLINRQDRITMLQLALDNAVRVVPRLASRVKIIFEQLPRSHDGWRSTFNAWTIAVAADPMWGYSGAAMITHSKKFLEVAYDHLNGMNNNVLCKHSICDGWEHPKKRQRHYLKSRGPARTAQDTD